MATAEWDCEMSTDGFVFGPRLRPRSDSNSLNNHVLDELGVGRDLPLWKLFTREDSWASCAEDTNGNMHPTDIQVSDDPRIASLVPKSRPRRKLSAVKCQPISKRQAKMIRKSSNTGCQPAIQSYGISNFVCQSGLVELKIVRQPEEEHRARYLSEGSRGAIKDRTGTSHVTVKLDGVQSPVALNMFAATASGPPVPHPYYKLIVVPGKTQSTTPCREFKDNGIDYLQVPLRPENDMRVVLDCLGILKLCTYDVKGTEAKSTKLAKRSSVRLVFRCNVPHPENDDTFIQLENVSTPIVCVQQLGLPEIFKMSLESCDPQGGATLFLIGKNFSKNAVVQFREVTSDGRPIWTSDAIIDQALVHQCHIVCRVPTYRELSLCEPLSVQVVVVCGKKYSKPIPFTYKAVCSSPLPEPRSRSGSYSLHSRTSTLTIADSSDCESPPIRRFSRHPLAGLSPPLVAASPTKWLSEAPTPKNADELSPPTLEDVSSSMMTSARLMTTSLKSPPTPLANGYQHVTVQPAISDVQVLFQASQMPPTPKPPHDMSVPQLIQFLHEDTPPALMPTKTEVIDPTQNMTVHQFMQFFEEETRQEALLNDVSLASAVPPPLPRPCSFSQLQDVTMEDVNAGMAAWADPSLDAVQAQTTATSRATPTGSGGQQIFIPVSGRLDCSVTVPVSCH